MAAKSTLKLKNVNVPAAIAGQRMYAAQAAKNPNLQANQILNRISPNARKNYIAMTSAVPSDMLGGNVPMNQFRSTLQKLRQARGASALNNSVDVIDILDKEQLSEALKDEGQPPPMLLLRRKGIRIFPDGRRVALYTNDQLGLIFTIPYNAPVGGPTTVVQVPFTAKEEVESTDSMILENLEQVAAYAQEENPKALAKHMKFADGSKLKVSHGAAKAIHMVHGALNDENKKKFADMLNNPKGFEKAAHFALNKVNFTINK